MGLSGFPPAPSPRISLDERIIPVVDLGATHTRTAFVVAGIQEGRFVGLPRLAYPREPRKARNPTRPIADHAKGLAADLMRTLQKTVEALKEDGQRILKVCPCPLLKVVAISAPGAWLESGYPYRGTVPNLPDLENVRLAQEVAKMMGPGWRAAVNNDGVASVLCIAHSLLTHLDEFPAAREALEQDGKIVGLLPGTGFGAGAVHVKEGQAVPVPGPQQFFDIIVAPGEGRIVPHGLTVEDLATGGGLQYQAQRDETLGGAFRREELTGETLASLTEHASERLREAALGLYRRAGEAIARTMILTHEGGARGEPRKAVVNDPQELETRFWENVRGTRVFLLGGWLTSTPARKHTLPVVESILKEAGFRFALVMADAIPGIRDLVEKDSVGLVGAALAVGPLLESLSVQPPAESIWP